MQTTHALSDVSVKSSYATLSPDSLGSPVPSLSNKLPSLRALADLRGGQSVPDDPHQQHAYYTHPDANDGNSSNPPTMYEDGFANYNPSYLPESTGISNDPEHLFQESVQERVDRWKADQMEQYGKLSAQDEANPRDARGRLKLLQNVSKGSRAIIFFIAMWRNMYLLELADLSLKGGLRMLVRTCLAMLFVGNMAGTVASIMSPGHATKNRLKGILNLDKLVEFGLLCWSFLRITVLPARLVPRETFFAGIMHSVFFILQMQAFTRLTWDDGVAPVVSNQKTNSPSQVGEESLSNYHTLGQTDSYLDYSNVYAEAADTSSNYDQHVLTRDDSHN
jgi:hypothetical protein